MPRKNNWRYEWREALSQSNGRTFCWKLADSDCSCSFILFSSSLTFSRDKCLVRNECDRKTKDLILFDDTRTKHTVYVVCLWSRVIVPRYECWCQLLL